MFTLYDGDSGNLPKDDHHLVFKWDRDDCLILFSICKKGEAASCHFSSNKSGLRLLKAAIHDFVEFVRNKYEWCKMVLAQINKSSVCRLVEKVGFIKIGEARSCQIYMKAFNYG